MNDILPALTLRQVAAAYEQAEAQAVADNRTEETPFIIRNPYVLKMFVENIQQLDADFLGIDLEEDRIERIRYDS